MYTSVSLVPRRKRAREQKGEDGGKKEQTIKCPFVLCDTHAQERGGGRKAGKEAGDDFLYTRRRSLEELIILAQVRVQDKLLSTPV